MIGGRATTALKGVRQLRCTFVDLVAGHGGRSTDLRLRATAVDVPEKGVIDLPFVRSRRPAGAPGLPAGLFSPTPPACS